MSRYLVPVLLAAAVGLSGCASTTGSGNRPPLREGADTARDVGQVIGRSERAGDSVNEAGEGRDARGRARSIERALRDLDRLSEALEEMEQKK